LLAGRAKEEGPDTCRAKLNRRARRVQRYLKGFAPPITDVFPGFSSTLNLGFCDNARISSSRVITLLAVGAVLLLGADELGTA
jgi:hypothetical protein